MRPGQNESPDDDAESGASEKDKAQDEARETVSRNRGTSTQAPQPSDATQRSRFHVLLNIVVSVTVLAACLYAFTLLGERKRPQRSKPRKAAATVVTTQPLLRHEGKFPLETNGVVVPLREIRLATEVAGRVVELSENLRPGKRVFRGDTLIRVDPANYQLNLNQLLAQQKQEAAEINSIEVSTANTDKLVKLAGKQMRLAENDRQRAAKLLANRAISAAEVDIAKRAELDAQAALTELNNKCRELEAQREMLGEKQSLTKVLLRRAKLDLERCVVVSPITGRIVQSSVEQQSFVDAGTAFVTIEDTSKVEVRSSLTANQMVWVWSDRQATNNRHRGDSRGADLATQPAPESEVPQIAATVTYQFGSETHQWPAKLMRIDGTGIDLQTRTYPCVFQVDAPKVSVSNSASQQLTRGMFVGLKLEIDSNQTLYEIPTQAIRPGNRIWINDAGKLKIVPVSVATQQDGTFVVSIKQTDLRASELAAALLVTSPISYPAEGMPLADQKSKQPLEGKGKGTGSGKSKQTDSAERTAVGARR